MRVMTPKEASDATASREEEYAPWLFAQWGPTDLLPATSPSGRKGHFPLVRRRPALRSTRAFSVLVRSTSYSVLVRATIS